MIETKYKMPRKLRDAWIADLTSGEFKQGEGSLHNESGKFCCLGVLACTAKKLGYPIALVGFNGDFRAEHAEDALEWDGKPHDAGDYYPMQQHLFLQSEAHGSSGFFSPFVRRNDGWTGVLQSIGAPDVHSIPKHSFTEIAEFIRENVEAVDEEPASSGE